MPEPISLRSPTISESFIVSSVSAPLPTEACYSWEEAAIDQAFKAIIHTIDAHSYYENPLKKAHSGRFSDEKC
jgi:hypothetical protein